MTKSLCCLSGLTHSLDDMPDDILTRVGDAVHRHADLNTLRAFVSASKAHYRLPHRILVDKQNAILVSRAACHILPKCNSEELAQLFDPVLPLPDELSMAQSGALRALTCLTFRYTTPCVNFMASLRTLFRHQVCPQLDTLEFIICQENTRATTAFDALFGEGWLSNLIKLSIEHCRVSSTAAISLFDAMGEDFLYKLQHFDISNNRISDAGLKAFASAFAKVCMPNLKTISLSSNWIGEEGMEAFSLAIIGVGVVRLTGLDLSNNRIGDRGLLAFSKTFNPNSNSPSGSMASLDVLNLNANRISDAGLVALFDTISQGSMAKLKWLGLGDNQISDDGAIALSEAIDKDYMANLQDLHLYRNNISDDGMVSLSAVIGNGSLPACKCIHVSENPGNTAPLKAACAMRTWHRLGERLSTCAYQPFN